MSASPDMKVNVAPGADNVNLIVNELSLTAPSGGTPTAAALSRAYDYFSTGAGASLTGNKYVLLATDGGPNCNSNLACEVTECTLNLDNMEGCPPDGYSCCANSPDGCLDDAATVAQIERLRTIDVTTIVVGIPGSEVYEANLNAFAEAGGAALTGGDASYYQVSAEGGVEELTSTFRQITTQLVTSCRLPIDEVDLTVVNLNQVNVAVECEIVGYSQTTPADTSVGWWYFDNVDAPTEIIIDGPTCDTIMRGVERIDAVFGCARIDVL
jgi:hypothetical protein